MKYCEITPLVTSAYLKTLFYYAPSSGILYNKVNRANGKVKANTPIIYSNKGYIQVSVCGRLCRVHRLIWIMSIGDIPKDKEIDHIDGNRSNNRLENLRLVRHNINCQNQKLRRTNTSGTCGVRWNTSFKKWSAYIHINYKRLHLGYFKNKKEAIKARKEAEKKYGFHPNHGREVL